MNQLILDCSVEVCRPIKKIKTPLTKADVDDLRVGDRVEIFGTVYTGRDAVLPKLVASVNEGVSDTGVDLKGGIIFHTAVSPAGVGPTSSNKQEIEESIPPLSVAGIRLHLGKGALGTETVKALDEAGSLFAVLPPVTALLQSKIKKAEVVAFPEEGMEAMHRLEVEGFPAIIAVAHGETIYKKNN